MIAIQPLNLGELMSKSAALQAMYDRRYDNLSPIKEIKPKAPVVETKKKEEKEEEDKMLEFTSNEDGSRSRLAALKGSKGLSLAISMPVRTAFGIQYSNAVKNLNPEEAMEFRDFLISEYPIDLKNIEDAEVVL